MRRRSSTIPRPRLDLDAGLGVRTVVDAKVETRCREMPVGDLGPGLAALGKVSDRVEAEKQKRIRNAQAIIDDPETLLPILGRQCARSARS
jgi:hypothetical protein